MIGDKPARREVASAVHRLVDIFQKTQKPPVRTVTGLFGELFLISRSTNPVKALTAWRVENTARFDFVDGDVRLDMKTTSGRVRAHIFSYEQCNPPAGTVAVVGSMFVERASGGITLRSLIDDISAKVASYNDLVFKLHEGTAATLGMSLNEAMAMAFDEKLADRRCASLISPPCLLFEALCRQGCTMYAFAPICRRWTICSLKH